jgi:PAS domain S-box-containing protein
MRGTAAQHRAPDGTTRHLKAYAYGGAAAFCAAIAGALSASAVQLAVPFAIAATILTVLTFVQVRGLVGETDRLGKLLTDAEHAATYDRTAHGRMQNLVDSISDGFVLWDSQERLTLYNPQASIDKSPAVSIGTTFDEYVTTIYPRLDEQTTGGDAQLWLNTRRKWFEDADGSHEVLLKSGSWMLISERRTRDGGTVTIYTDITESKRAEQRRDDSQRRLTHAQKLARLGIFEWDAVASEIYWSDIMYEIVGLAPDSPPLDFSQYLLLVRTESRELVRSTFRRLLTSGGKYNQEYEIVRPDGQTRAVRAEAEAVVNEKGDVVRILGFVHDQTGAKRIETALRLAKETAVQASKSKSEFLANVSHELRTPLNAIIGFSEVMIQEVFGPVGNARYHDYAGDIRQSGVHLLGVINDLLDYSKLDAGRLELHSESVSLNRIVDKSVRMMRQEAEGEDITLIGKTSEIEGMIWGDEQKVTQIVLNLVSNAIKFTPPKGIVTVSLHEAEDGVDIQVTDSGIGMSPSDIELALAPFGQVDSALSRRHAGTGLGLPLSKSLAELHGGSLKIASAPGEGTTVTVHLSRKPADTDEAPALRLVMGGGTGIAPCHGRTGRIEASGP